MKFSCPECGQRIEVKESWAGREINCPNLKFEHRSTLRVPSPQDAALPEPARPTPPAETPKPAPPATSRSAGPLPEAPLPSPPLAAKPASGQPPLPPQTRARFSVGAVGQTMLIFAMLGYFVALAWFNESPQRFWKRLTGESAAFEASAPAETPLPAPVQTAVPTPAPIAAATPATPPPSVAIPAVPGGLAPLREPGVAATPAPAVIPAPAPLPILPMQADRPDIAPPTAREPTPARASGYFGSSGGDEGEAQPSRPAATAAPARAGSYFGTMDGGNAGDPEPPRREFPATGLLKTIDREDEKADALSGRRVVLRGTGALHLTGAGDPLSGSVVNFTSPDGWLFLENMRPSAVASTLLDRLWVNGAPAKLDANLRVASYGSGTVVIPQGPDFAAMQVFQGEGLSGVSLPLRPGVKYDDASLGTMKVGISSFRLKRGYTATIAQEENGTGVSKNYVAQDGDLEVRSLPAELNGKIRFVRIFPWRWTPKKGVAGGIWQNLNVGWFYNWNISDQSRPELEYVPIKQKRGWPGLNQDWVARGSTALLGYNEPDHKDQSNLTVDEAIAGWPELLGTGLRLGSPSVSDGGLGWLFDFMQKADAAKLRVDFVAVHYYRAVGNPGDARGAAAQFYNYLRGIHDRTHRPIWVTEWNNGANWTGHKPDYEQERAAVAEMVKMLEETPFVERYAIYNWVEDTRNVQRKDGSLTPAGEVYRDKVSKAAYTQARP